MQTNALGDAVDSCTMSTCARQQQREKKTCGTCNFNNAFPPRTKLFQRMCREFFKQVFPLKVAKNNLQNFWVQYIYK